MRRTAKAWLFGLVLSLSAVAVMGSAQAWADPGALTVTVTNADLAGGAVEVTGRAAVGDQGVAGLGLDLVVNGASMGMAITGADGGFSYSFPAGDTVSFFDIQAVWPGDARYGATSGAFSLTVERCTTALTLALDPADTQPGTNLSVAGSLMCGTTPVPAAMIGLTTSYGQVEAVAATGADGGFVSSVTIPDGGDFPASFSVTASFAGDGVYPAATAQAAGTITAAPVDQSSASEPLPSDPVSAPAPTMAGASGVPDARGAASSGSASIMTGADLALLGVVFAVVAIVAAAVLLILGIISHRHKRLEADERRGFGTDFGKED